MSNNLFIEYVEILAVYELKTVVLMHGDKLHDGIYKKLINCMEHYSRIGLKLAKSQDGSPKNSLKGS